MATQLTEFVKQRAVGVGVGVVVLGGISLLCGLLGLVGDLGRSPDRSRIFAREIVLTDHHGNERIRLHGGAENESPRIVIYSESGRPQIELFVNNLGSMATLYDPSDRPRVIMDAADELSQIGLKSQKGKVIWGHTDQ